MIRFSSQWNKKSNFLFIIKNENIIFRYFIKLYFNNWIENDEKTNISNIIIIDFKHNKSNKIINKSFFDYSREKSDQTITTYVSNLRFFRSLVREIYKIIKPNVSLVGIWELYLDILRTGIFEPLEYFLRKDNYSLVHSGVVKINNKTLLFLGKSKSGKSTIIKHIINNINYDKILSDNYAFIKNREILTVPELFRSGKPKRFKINIYKRNCKNIPLFFEEKLDMVIILKLSNKNQITNIDKSDVTSYLKDIYYSSKEGIAFINKKDILYSNKEKSILLNTKDNYLLEIKKGISNIKQSLHYLINKI
jgi:hypothetical protein